MSDSTVAAPDVAWHSRSGPLYFVHSYYVDAENPRQVAGSCQYGVELAAAVADGARFAVQFHPEKSHTHGLQLYKTLWLGMGIGSA